jgi:Cdc6-like AAA superfamily ATPase
MHSSPSDSADNRQSSVKPVHETTRSFWGGKDIHVFPSEIVFIRNENVDQVDREWPGPPPGMSAVKHELSLSEACFIVMRPVDDCYSVTILSGRLVVKGMLRPKEDGWRLYLNNLGGIGYASNRQRGWLIPQGTMVQHKGIRLVSGGEFQTNFERQDNYWRGNSYGNQLLLIPRPEWSDVEWDQGDENGVAVSSEEEQSLSVLQAYVDAEHEIEEQLARETPPFLFHDMTYSAHGSANKTIVKATLDREDHARLAALAPFAVKLGGHGEENAPSLAVEDVEPKKGVPEITLSVNTRDLQCQLPSSGQFVLDVSNVLHKTRTDVIDSLLRDNSPNKWLAPMIAGKYRYPNLFKEKVAIPKSIENPPNERQQESIERGAGTADIALVLGPPGTGKTTIIISWVRHFISQGKRVLITSQNNKAVDNVLERVMEEDSVQCLRLGNESKVLSGVHPALIDNCATELQRKLLKNAEKCCAELEEYRGLFAGVKGLLSSQSSRIGRFDDLTVQAEELPGQLKSTRDGIKAAREEKQGMEAAVADEQRKIQDLERDLRERESRNFMVRLFTKAKTLLTKMELSRQRKKYEALQGRVAELDMSIKASTQSAEDIEEKIAAVQSERNSVIASISAVFPENVGAPVPEVEVPEFRPETIKSLALFVEDIKKVLNRLDTVIELAAKWNRSIGEARQQVLYKLLLTVVDVVGATCIGINTKQMFKDVDFDVVIVDESGQIQLHNLIVPLSRGPKAILVGDHKQLPPVVDQDLTEELRERAVPIEQLEKSFFEILWDTVPEDRKVSLNTQYRCPSVVSDYISQAFYGGDYHAGPNVLGKGPFLSFLKSAAVLVDTSGVMERREKTSCAEDRNEVVDNPLETKIVIFLLDRIMKEKPELGSKEVNEIGIIVPYKKHAEYIRAAIRKERKKGRLQGLTIPLEEMVATVDSFQGQERAVIIHPMTRSNRRGAIGFLKDWRRINVAMTRGKKQLIMVGDMSTLGSVYEDTPEGDVFFKQSMALLKTHMKQSGQYLRAEDMAEVYALGVTTKSRKPWHSPKTRNGSGPETPRKARAAVERVGEA